MSDVLSVSKKTIVDLVAEALGVDDIDTPINVNSVVDPSAAVTDVLNSNFVPQNKAELLPALKMLLSDMPDDSAAELYKIVKKSVDKLSGDDVMNKSNKKPNKNVEETIRREVRKIIFEMLPLLSKEKDPADVDEPKEKPVDDDVKGSKDIAKEIGGSPALVSRLNMIAAEKLRILGGLGAENLSAEEWEDYMDIFWNHVPAYIKYLQKSGELTASDVELMKRHPDIVIELEGFRDNVEPKVRTFLNSLAHKKGLGKFDPFAHHKKPGEQKKDVAEEGLKKKS